ncbi:hypothetical protein KY317_01385 [Candidatus Woesearchaeota archaeon]|nr:hypothetical protein [Candidatus Woesearchaeota archaeon]
MVSDTEFGHLVSEFESLKDIFIDELSRLKTEMETIKEDLLDLKKELNNSGGITIKKRLG